MRKRISGQVAYAARKNQWFEHNVPTVQPKEAANINANPAQAGYAGNEQPACDSSKRPRNHRLHQEQRQKTQNQPGQSTGENQDQVHPEMRKMTARQVNDVGEDVRRIGKE